MGNVGSAVLWVVVIALLIVPQITYGYALARFVPEFACLGAADVASLPYQTDRR